MVVCNSLYFMSDKSDSVRIYRVEAKRVAMELQEKSLEEIDLTDYQTILKVSVFQGDEICNHDYVVEDVDGVLYRIEYEVSNKNNILLYFNGTLLVMFFLTFFAVWYVGKKVLLPFHAMSNLSYELAKGNLSMPVKEEKSKLFGRFLWGMDMLREKLEDNKKKELEFQKERKMLILSLSHDIKTPLSSIELYSKALLQNIYKTQEKKTEALQIIDKNVKEIKKYVDEIVNASREDFLNLEVIPGEVYLSEVINTIKMYYKEKLSVIHTDFVVEDFLDCMIWCDKDRLIEVLQNVMENALKYGDGEYIKIYTEDEEDCKLIHIENSGCNLKEEELPNLFDSFYRGSNSQKAEGNGLGLYICKCLMRKMDGAVYAQMKDKNFLVTVVVQKV